VARLAQAVSAQGGTPLPMLSGAARRGAADVWLSRLGSGTPPAEVDLLETRGLRPMLNGPRSLHLTHDKPLALARLSAAGLPVPPTLLVLRDVPPERDALPGERLVVKPPTGQSGRGVMVGLPRDEAFARAQAYAELCGRALVQPWLGQGLDRRVLQVGSRAVAAMQRRPGPDGRGNVAQGGEATAWQPDASQLSLARRAQQTLGLDVAGVDLLVHAGRTLILEVNACPGFTAIEAVCGEDVAGAVARLALQRAGEV